jgi:DNA repair protein RecO (recombination protein O)
MTIRIADEGYIIAQKGFSESKNRLSVFTKEHGRVDGIAPLYKKSPLDIGACVTIKWSAKLPHQLGFMEVDALKPVALMIQKLPSSQAYTTLLMLQSALSLLSKTLVLHHAYPLLYGALEGFMASLSMSSYITFELTFLRELGFGLSLDQCIVTGSMDNLVYISPKSGCAVSQKAGEAYVDKLLMYPKLFDATTAQDYSPFDITQALQVLGYFIQKHLLSHELPLPRQMLLAHCASLKTAA